MQDARRMITDAQVGFGAESVKLAFGMCHMTTCFERSLRGKDALAGLDFVEFLEFIGRVAELKFAGSELEEQLNLAQKIDYVLDDILPLIGLKR